MSRAPRLLSALPTFLVPDVRASAEYYRDVFGARLAMLVGEPPELFSIVDFAEGQGFDFAYDDGKPARRNRAPGGIGLDAYVRIDDADAWHARFVARGARVLEPPTDRPWRMREFVVQDRDGLVLCFGADLTGAWPRGLVTTSPQFMVADVARTATFYRERLGFPTVDLFFEPPKYAIAIRDGVQIHFGLATAAAPARSNHDTAGIWDAYVEVEGADALAAEFRSRGVPLLRGPETAEYGMREIEVRDPDGYVLCFGEEVGAPR